MEFQFRVAEHDFANGYFLTRKLVSPLHLPSVQAGLCLTGVALCASMIPTSLRYFGGLWAPAIGMGVFGFLAGLFGWLLPSLSKNRGSWMYHQNRTLSLPGTMRLFENRLEWQNSCEWVLAYWTDLERCYEDRRYFVLQGDLEKPLFVIPKQCLEEGQQKDLKRFLQNKLTVRYRGG